MPIAEERGMGTAPLPAYEAFARSANTKFIVEFSSWKQLEIRLTQVSEKEESVLQEQFSLLFHGPIDEFMPQGTYTLRHTTLGTFDLFLVPIGQNQEGFSYEAVFNLLRQSS